MSVDLLRALPRTNIRLAYDRSRADVTYVYRVTPGSTLTALRPLPAIRDETRFASADVTVSLTRQLALGAWYWYEDHVVDDFSFSPATLNSLNPPGSLLLGYVFRPYTISSATLRLICTW